MWLVLIQPLEIQDVLLFTHNKANVRGLCPFLNIFCDFLALNVTLRSCARLMC